MQIDLKVPGALTYDSVRALLASKDDRTHRQLGVTTNGIAFLSDDVGNRNLEGVLFRFETWDPGNGYCGHQAAADDKWVRSVHQDLIENLPNQKSNFIDS